LHLYANDLSLVTYRNYFYSKSQVYFRDLSETGKARHQYVVELLGNTFHITILFITQAMLL